MERTCARAVAIGVPAVAFTEHADFTTWTDIDSSAEWGSEFLRSLRTPEATLTPPLINLDGYLECLQRCRDQYPQLRIISGVELGEPHWHPAAAEALLNAGQFERVLCSQHCLPVGHGHREVAALYGERPAADVLRDYLAEVARLIEECAAFSVLAHIDYAIRDWPDDEGPFDPRVFEAELRHALKTLAASGRVLEVNTRSTLPVEVVRWWRDEGGQAISFGSDAHSPEALACGFTAAAAMVEANGFRPGRDPLDFWLRSG
jgi:histidinol-phosphatase (PHP family)